MRVTLRDFSKTEPLLHVLETNFEGSILFEIVKKRTKQPENHPIIRNFIIFSITHHLQIESYVI